MRKPIGTTKKPASALNLRSSSIASSVPKEKSVVDSAKKLIMIRPSKTTLTVGKAEGKPKDPPNKPQSARPSSSKIGKKIKLTRFILKQKTIF